MTPAVDWIDSVEVIHSSFFIVCCSVAELKLNRKQVGSVDSNVSFLLQSSTHVLFHAFSSIVYLRLSLCRSVQLYSPLIFQFRSTKLISITAENDHIQLMYFDV